MTGSLRRDLRLVRPSRWARPRLNACSVPTSSCIEQVFDVKPSSSTILDRRCVI